MTLGTPDDVTAWALAARDGDPTSVAALVRATQRDVWRLCASLVDRDSADDLSQECYLRALRALPGFVGRSSARTWLLTIARRTCADHVRGAVRRRHLDERLQGVRAGTAADPVSHSMAADLLARLSPPFRAAFVLTQLVGLSYDEAAAVEGVVIGTIRSRVARARAELVAQLTSA